MSVSEWKEINLFKIVPASDNIKLSNIKGNITTHCYNNISKVFCDNLGYVYVYSQKWECEYFKAQDRAIFLCAISEDNILVILTQDEQQVVHLKIFNINKLNKSAGALCLGFAKLEVPNLISSLSIYQLDVQLCIAFGSEKGDIYFHRNVVNKDISPSFRNFSLTYRAITGIQFKKRNKTTCNMFVCSDGGIFCFSISENNNVFDAKIILDNKHESSRCCGMSKSSLVDDNYFIIGRDDAVYCFTSDGRGPCYPIKGFKTIVQLSSNFLIMIISKQNPTHSPVKISTVVIIDIFNKIIVLNKEIDPIVNIIVQPQSCYLITESSKVLVLSELSLRSKLRELVSKHLYDIAIRQLQDAGKDLNEIGTIYLEYGDYLLNNGDLKSAIDMYIKTISIVSPYQIIEKLLDSKYTEHLSKYLEALIKSEHNNEEYKILFSNCKKRLNLISKFDNIYYKECLEFNSKRQICSDISYTNFTIKSLTNIFQSKQQISSDLVLLCNEDEIYKFFTNNSKMLMQDYPEKVANVLKILCLNSKGSQIPERFLPLMLSNKNSCIIFLEEIIQNAPDNCNKSIYHILFQMHLHKWRNEKCHSDKIIAFLNNFEKYINIQFMLILCGFYKFWDRILNTIESFKNEKLFIKNIVKNCKFYNQLLKYEDNIDIEMWIKTIEVPRLNCTRTLEILNNAINNAIKEGNEPLLQVLKNLVSNENILVGHLKEFFLQELVVNLTDYKCTNCSTILNELQTFQNIFENYINNPIEFRSSTCDKCKSPLKLPVVYYLCQHSFHKQCISAYSQRLSCIHCNAKDLSNTKFGTKMNIYSNKIVYNSIHDISIVLGSGIFKNKKIKNISIHPKQENNLLSGKSLSEINSIKNENRQSNGNPFQEIGLNPFEY